MYIVFEFSLYVLKFYELLLYIRIAKRWLPAVCHSIVHPLINVLNILQICQVFCCNTNATGFPCQTLLAWAAKGCTALFSL